jgi:predicted Zn-dependent protease
LARRLTLREALASDRLEDFVRQEEARGEVLAKGSDLERALALLITQRQSGDRTSRSVSRGGSRIEGLRDPKRKRTG